MRQLLKKIPITFWTLLLIVVAAYVFTNNMVDFNGTKLDSLTKLLTIVGLYYLAIQVRNQTKSEKISTEFLNQPNFSFTGFCVKDIKNAMPCLCSQPGTLNYNQCSDIHWFNFKQTGTLPAKDMKIILIHGDEQEDISSIINTRTQTETMVYNNDEHQFKLTQQAIPLKYLNPKHNGKMIILIEYKSVYTDIKYKRIYHLGYSPAIAPDAVPTSWIDSIKYYSLGLDHIVDSETITWTEILKNLWKRFLRKLHIVKAIDIHDWLIDL